MQGCTHPNDPESIRQELAGGWKPSSGRTDYAHAGKVFCHVLLREKVNATMFANAPKSGTGIPSSRFSCQRCKLSHNLHMEEIDEAVAEKLKKVKITPQMHKLMVVTEWERYKRDKEQMNIKGKRLLTLKANAKKDMTEAEETLSRMKYCSKPATKQEIKIQERVLACHQEDVKNPNEKIAKLDEDGIQRYYDLDAFLELAKNAFRW